MGYPLAPLRAETKKDVEFSTSGEDPLKPPSAAPRLRRFTAVLVSTLMAVAGLVVLAVPAGASPPAFNSVFNQSTTGDVIIRGNTLMTCPAGSLGATSNLPCATAQGAGSTGLNNEYVMGFVDTDGDSATTNSSGSSVTIPSGATVLYAGLSWAANTSAGVNGVAATSLTNRNLVSLKAPGGSYTTLTADRVDGPATNTAGGPYQGYKNVTSTVSAAGAGTYWVGNVQGGTGLDRYAGWSLAVAYQFRRLRYATLSSTAATARLTPDIPPSTSR